MQLIFPQNFFFLVEMSQRMLINHFRHVQRMFHVSQIYKKIGQMINVVIATKYKTFLGCQLSKPLHSTINSK